MPESQCYNLGCQKTFDPAFNTEDSCTFHSSKPVFHDAYKIWPCCDKKSTFFYTFLNTPGCSKGPHSSVKVQEPSPVREIQAPSVQEAAKPKAPRPPRDSTMIRPVITTGPGVKTFESSSSNSDTLSSKGDGVISPGEPCKNSGCKSTYNPKTTDDECKYHSGVPVFHEGLKYWSCCQRKTTDFSAFLAQEPCFVGKHKWVKEESESVQCKVDWHQTYSTVTVVIYAKNVNPDKSFVELNSVRLFAKLKFTDSDTTFEFDKDLKEAVNPSETKVVVMNTKVEILLEKSDPCSWSGLEMVVSKPKEICHEKKEPSPDASVDALDLDDLDFSRPKMILSTEASAGKTDAKII